MFKRLYWLLVGFILGLGSSWYVMRKLRQTVARYAPAEVVDRWNGNVQGLRRDMQSAFLEGRSAMHEREAELKAGFPQPAQRVSP